MTESTVVSLPLHGGVEDPLTEVLPAGARELVRHAVEAEVAALLAAYDDERTERGRRHVVRHGHGPKRAVLTGIGPVVVRRPKVRDRRGTGEGRILFSSQILPRPVLPVGARAAVAVVRRGAADAVSTGRVERGLRGGAVGARGSRRVGAVAGRARPFEGGVGVGTPALASAGSVEPAVCLRLGGRDLPPGTAGRREAVRSGADRGDARGHKGTAGVPGRVPGERPELAGVAGGPEAAWPPGSPGTGDRGRGLGLWKALDEVFPKARRQRCWVHKTQNVLNALPKSPQRNAKQDLHQIWMATNRKEAERRWIPSLPNTRPSMRRRSPA